MGRDEFSLVLEALDVDATKAMRLVARIQKSKTNVFHEDQLARKKKLRGADLPHLLRGLQALGLVRWLKDGLWRTTSLGRRVAHALESEWVKDRYGMRFERR